MRKAVLFVALMVFWFAFVLSAYTSLKVAATYTMPNLYFDDSGKWYTK